MKKIKNIILFGTLLSCSLLSSVAMAKSETELTAYDSDEIGEYHFYSLATGLWKCSGVGQPQREEYQALLTVSPSAIGFYLHDETVTFENFKLTTTQFRRNHYVSVLNRKWIAFQSGGNGVSSELEFNYEFNILTRKIYLPNQAFTSNYLCVRQNRNP